MDGIGLVITSSPTSSTSGRPAGSHASTDAPSMRACSSPSYTGSVATPPTNAVHMSVPPEVENSHRSGPRCSYSQSKPSGESGEPVEPTDRSEASDRPPPRGSAPSFMQADTNAAEVPKQVIFVSSASSHNRSIDG